MLCFLHYGSGVALGCTGLIMPAPGNQSPFWRLYHIRHQQKRDSCQLEIEAENAIQSLRVTEYRSCQIFAWHPWIRNMHGEVAEQVAHAPFRIKPQLGKVQCDSRSEP